MQVQLEITQARCTASDSCLVTVKKTGTTETLAGVKVAFANVNNSYSPEALDSPYDLASLVPTVLNNGTAFDSGIVAPSKVEVTPYFEDASGNEQLCTNQVATLSFVAP
jgi:hypothetical protein